MIILESPRPRNEFRTGPSCRGPRDSRAEALLVFKNGAATANRVLPRRNPGR
jgi:hypothetical protein